MALEESQEVPITALGERLCEAPALEAMQRSLARHGQMTGAVGFSEGETVELIDGLKRLRAARVLGWPTLRTQLVDVDAVGATLMIATLHEARALTKLEEGWLVRALYREHGLLQPTIALRLGRHKNWVHRRLMLVEAPDGAVQARCRARPCRQLRGYRGACGRTHRGRTRQPAHPRRVRCRADSAAPG